MGQIIFKHISDQCPDLKHAKDGCERMGLDDEFAIAMVENMAKQNTTSCCCSHVRVER